MSRECCSRMVGILKICRHPNLEEYREMASVSPTTKTAKAPKPLPVPNSDFYDVYETLAPEELATVKRVRAFMEAKVEPLVTKYWVDDAFPFEVLPAVKELSIGGLGMQGY